MKRDNRGRTGKTFVDYNEYHDRPFGLKWGTAFALDELTKVITSAKSEATKQVEALPIMTREAQDEVLRLAFMKSRIISIQRYERDNYGNLLDCIDGKFEGKYDEEHLYLKDLAIAWEDIRNISIKG